MSSTAEKTNQTTTVQQKAQQQTFFRKAGEETFFGTNEPRSFFNAPVQAKLSISSPDDPQEKEADAVADKVMRMAEPAPVSTKDDEKLQRKEEKEEKDEEVVQPKTEAPVMAIQRKEETEELQAKSIPDMHRSVNDDAHHIVPVADSGEEKEKKISTKKIGLHRSDMIQQSGRGPPTSSIPFEQSLSSSKGGGSALPGDTKQFMESRFDTDFSGVHIHTNSNAENLSRDINAQAFTHGNDIYFNSGKYSPNTAEGGTLLAHELTHTIQQGRSDSSAKKINPLLNDDSPSQKKANLNQSVAGKHSTTKSRRRTENAKHQSQVTSLSPTSGKEENRDTGKAKTLLPAVDHKVERRNKQDRKQKKSNKAGKLNRKPSQSKKIKGKTTQGSNKAGTHVNKAKKHLLANSNRGIKRKTSSKKGKKSKPLNIKINASELKTSAPSVITSPHKRSQQVINAIKNKSSVAKENFAGQVSEKTGIIQSTLNSHLESVAQTGSDQELQLKGIFSSAKASVTSLISDSSEKISSHATAQGGLLSGAHATSAENVNTVFTSGKERVNNITNLYAGRSLDVAKSAADQFQTNVQAAVDQTIQITNSKANIGDSDPDVAEAKSEAAHQVGSDTTAKVTEGLTDGIDGLIASGPETADEFIKQGTEAGSQLMTGKSNVDTQVNQVFTNAATGIEQMANGAVQSMQQQKTPLLDQFDTQENSITGQLSEQVEQKKTDLQQTGQQIMIAFKQQALHSLAAGDSQLNIVSQQISSVNITEKDLPSAQSFAEQDINNAYSGFNLNLYQSTQALDGEINQKGNQVVSTIQAFANPVSNQVKSSTSQIDTNIRQSEQQHINQITDGTSQAIGGANSVLTQVSTGLTTQIDSIDTNFQQGLNGYNTGLLQQVNDGTARAMEPVNTLESRTDAAQQKAADRARKSWLEQQWDDFVEVISDPGFWAGLLVGLLLVALVIFFEVVTLGTATVVIVAIAAAIGGIAAGVGSIVGQAMNHSFKGGWDSSRINWGEVGKAVLMGAAAGAVFAVVAVIAVGSFGVATTGLAMIGIMSVTSGVVGIITNLVTGQPWDKGLLFNLALGGLLTWLMGKIPTRSGRNVPPTEEPPPGNKDIIVDPVPVDPILVKQQNIKSTPPEKVGGSIEWRLYDEASGATFAWQQVEVTPAGAPESGPHQTLTPKEAVLPDGSEVVLKAEGFSWTEVSIKMMMDMFEKIFGMKAPNLSGLIAWENLKNFQAEFAKIKVENPSLPEQEAGNQAVRKISYGKARIAAKYGQLSVDMSGTTSYTLPDGTVVDVPRRVYVNALPDP